MTRSEAIERGRESLRKQAWIAAFDQLLAADQEAPLDPEDLERLAMAAHLSGREQEASPILARAHQGFLGQGDTRRAARCAFWLGFVAFNNGGLAQASGWLARAERLLVALPDCVEQGYLLVPTGIKSAREGDGRAAYAAFSAAVVIGNRFADRDLLALALHGQGRALILQGEIARGVTLLDEAMVSVTAGEVSPLIAGAVYCSVIESCRETFDLGRAREWTAALDRWCESQPDLAPYRGHCLLSRAEIKQLRGAWTDALHEAETASRRLEDQAPKPALAAAYHLTGELHRLRGELPKAEEAYRQAGQWDPVARPGLALLRLAQGQVDAAVAAIQRSADGARGLAGRSRVLGAFVEIMIAANDKAAARAAADELAGIADGHGAAYLRAMARGATGAVRLAEGDARGALEALRESLALWSELEVPYESARVRVLVARACREEGDDEGAAFELAAAGRVFGDLGAAGDLARVEALLRAKRPASSGLLTGRELEVLRLVASGVTNRELASRLGISEKTVARHLSNIFGKLGVSSRAAATAYAFQHDLV